MSQPFRIEVAGETNVGRKRNHNEDNFAIMAEFGLFVVADGMGGHASGEVASKMAVDAMQEFFSQTAEDPERTWPYKMDRSKGYEENRLITGIKLANLRIYVNGNLHPTQPASVGSAYDYSGTSLRVGTGAYYSGCFSGLTRGVNAPGERSASDAGRYSLTATKWRSESSARYTTPKPPAASFLTIE